MEWKHEGATMSALKHSYISTSSLEHNATIQSLRSVVMRELKGLTWMSEHSEDSCERKTELLLICDVDGAHNNMSRNDTSFQLM